MSIKYNIPYNKVPLKINPIDQELVTEISVAEKKSIPADGEKQDERYYEIPKLLDGFRLLNSALSEDPEYVYSVDISRQDLRFVLEDDLVMFTRLETLKAGENRLPFSKLGAIPSLRKLILPCNEIVCLDLEVEGRFDYLEHLDLSYNSLDISALAVLASLPSLKYLDVTRNELSRFPSVIRTMHKWKDYVIERLLPKQVAAMESSLVVPEAKKENATLLSQDVHVSKRSFKSTVSISRSRSRSRLSLTENQKEEMRRSESRISSVVKKLAGGFTPKTGFPELQTLILEGNNISSSDIFDILGALPNLVNLNMNHNMIMALNALIPNTYNGATDVLNDNPKNITKYNGFLKLEELSLKFNRIPQLDNLVGLLCLPKIKNVYLEGNSVLKYCCYSKTKAKEDDPFNIFSSIYKINIVDLPKSDGPASMNLETQYAVASTRYGMAVVKKPRKKEIPHFIGRILRKAAVRGPHFVTPHKIDPKKDKLVDIAIRNIRRSYSFTEDDIDNIIRMGHIPKIRDLRVFGETRKEMENELEDPVKIGAKDMLYDPEKQDSTFITGVHIAETGGPAQEANIELEESSEGDDDSDGERDFLSHYPLPLNIQTAVRSLRHAICNPTSYWRVLEDSYIRPTAASLSRKVDIQIKSDTGLLDAQNFSQPELMYSLEDIGVPKQPSEEFQNHPSIISAQITPANTSATPNNFTNWENDGFENIKPHGGVIDPSTFQHAVATAIGDGKSDERKIGSKAGKLEFKRIKRSRINQKGNDELLNLKSMMDGVEKKLTKIELDLSAVLKYSELQKKLPQSKQLLKEIKEEYNKLQGNLLKEAKAKFKEDLKTGFKDVDDATDSELHLNAH